MSDMQNDYNLSETKFNFAYLKMDSEIKIIHNEHYLKSGINNNDILLRRASADGEICSCPICDYFKTLLENDRPMQVEDIVPNDFSRIVERMGGDPPAKITEDECIRELSSLSDREYLCGAYWMFKQIFKVDHPILSELSLAKSREDMARILREHGL